MQGQCNFCGSQPLRPWQKRSDDVWIVRCDSCGLGIVERLPESLPALYGDAYYCSPPASETGYSDYSFVAEHSTSWAASLTTLLSASGRVLDIGCADGRLLRKLASTHNCSGIEVNERMAQACAAAGIAVVARDLFDPQLPGPYAGTFDVVLAIAVFEHLQDLKRAFQVAVQFLAPGGTLVFEVPLMSAGSSNDVWFRSSLEHVYYPSESSLHHLVEHELRIPLIGSELVIQDYGSTFVGLVPKETDRGESLRSLYQRLVEGPVSLLETPEEIRFRLQLRLIHAAQTTPDHLGLLDKLPPSDFNPLLVRRLADLWTRDQERFQAQLGGLKTEVEAIKRSALWQLVHRFARQ